MMLHLKFLFIFSALTDDQCELVGMCILGALLVAAVAEAVCSAIYDKHNKDMKK